MNTVHSENSSPEKQHYKVRVTAFERDLDANLAALTSEHHRHQLPPFLHLFSLRTVSVDTADEEDGYSVSAHNFAKYRQGLQTIQHSSRKHRLTGTVLTPKAAPVDSILLHVALSAAESQKLITPPLYPENLQQEARLPMRYFIPHPAANVDDVVLNLIDLIAETKETQLVDELTLVSSADPFRPLSVRSAPERNEARVRSFARRASATIIDMAAYRHGAPALIGGSVPPESA